MWSRCRLYCLHNPYKSDRSVSASVAILTRDPAGTLVRFTTVTFYHNRGHGSLWCLAWKQILNIVNLWYSTPRARVLRMSVLSCLWINFETKHLKNYPFINRNHIKLCLKHDIEHNLISRLDYKTQLQHNWIGCVLIKIRQSTSMYRANYSESMEQSFHHIKADKLENKAQKCRISQELVSICTFYKQVLDIANLWMASVEKIKVNTGMTIHCPMYIPYKLDPRRISYCDKQKDTDREKDRRQIDGQTDGQADGRTDVPTDR